MNMEEIHSQAVHFFERSFQLLSGNALPLICEIHSQAVHFFERSFQLLSGNALPLICEIHSQAVHFSGSSLPFVRRMLQ